MKTCTLCRREFDLPDPAVLYMDRYGQKRCVCQNCEALLDKASSDGGEKKAAVEQILALSGNLRDPEAAHVLRQIIDGEVSAEMTEEDEQQAAEWEENTSEEEGTEPTEQKATFWDYLPLILAVVAAAAFAVWFLVLR